MQGPTAVCCGLLHGTALGLEASARGMLPAAAQVLFIRTAGVYNRMRKEKPGQPDPLPELQKQLMSALGAADDSMPLTLQYPLFVILAKDPRPL